MLEAPPIRLPAGVRDFLPRAAARRRALAEQLLAVFEAWGYARIITPVFEVADVLERGLGADARAAAIRFVEPGTGEVVALRPDITPQVARLAATRMRDVPGPLRLCYEGAVTRLDGRSGQREILQAGIELIDAPAPARDAEGGASVPLTGGAALPRGDARDAEGGASVPMTGGAALPRGDAGDAEVLAVAAAALAAAELADARLDVGHVAPVVHVLAAVPPAVAPRLRAALARKDRAGVAALAHELPAGVADHARALVDLWGEPDAVLARARALAWPAAVTAALDQVERVLAQARALAGEPLAITLDLGELRGFDYYTGIRFAGYVAGAADAVLRGGRYDELLARYGRAACATGFAVDIEAIAEAHGDTVPAGPRGVLVAGDDPAAPAIASALRRVGLRAAVELAPRAVADLPAYLAAAGYDVAVVVAGPAATSVTAAGAIASIDPAALAAARAGAGGELARALAA